MLKFIVGLTLGVLMTCTAHSFSEPAQTKADTRVRLGNFSLSLTVKNLPASREFYEKLGFKVTAGNGKSWSVMMNDTSTTIGLFQGLFEKNSLTFNPGWDRNKATLPEFEDVRDLQE